MVFYETKLGSRMLDLMKVRCRLFQTTFNPSGIRTGNKILRERLKGPAMVQYYPRKKYGFYDMVRDFPELSFLDEKEIWRHEKLKELKLKGKGAPKKKKTAAEGKAGKKKKAAPAAVAAPAIPGG